MKSNTFPLILISLLISINCFEYIKYTEEDKISIITISRPEALNALNSQVLDELSQALDAIDTSKISALIITGDGEKSFVAGADISEMSSLSKTEAEDFSKNGNDVFRITKIVTDGKLKYILDMLSNLPFTELLNQWF